MTARVEREVVLPVAPEELWPALTDPAELREWLAPDVEIDARPGGGAVFRWEDAGRRAVVEEVDAPHRLAFRWAEVGEDGEAEQSRVVFTLEEVDGGTRLRVVESGIGESLAETVVALAGGAGWTLALARLRRTRRLAPVA